MPPVRERIVTSFSPQGAGLYGLQCLKSLRALPYQVDVYLDEPAQMPSGVHVHITEGIPNWQEVRSTLPTERPDAEKPTNYIWNAQKFAVKPFVWLDAAERLDSGVLVWLDADTVVKQPIQRGFFDDLLGDTSVAYLGRGEMHPETGFVAFRIPEALHLLCWCVECYVSGLDLLDDGWTDCHVLRAGIKATGIRARDLTSHLHNDWRSSVDAFALSPLGPYIHHLKGTKRKREAVTV